MFGLRFCVNPKSILSVRESIPTGTASSLKKEFIHLFHYGVDSVGLPIENHSLCIKYLVYIVLSLHKFNARPINLRPELKLIIIIEIKG